MQVVYFLAKLSRDASFNLAFTKLVGLLDWRLDVDCGAYFSRRDWRRFSKVRLPFRVVFILATWFAFRLPLRGFVAVRCSSSSIISLIYFSHAS